MRRLHRTKPWLPGLGITLMLGWRQGNRQLQSRVGPLVNRLNALRRRDVGTLGIGWSWRRAMLAYCGASGF